MFYKYFALPPLSLQYPRPFFIYHGLHTLSWRLTKETLTVNFTHLYKNEGGTFRGGRGGGQGRRVRVFLGVYIRTSETDSLGRFVPRQEISGPSNNKIRQQK